MVGGFSNEKVGKKDVTVFVSWVYKVMPILHFVRSCATTVSQTKPVPGKDDENTTGWVLMNGKNATAKQSYVTVPLHNSVFLSYE